MKRFVLVFFVLFSGALFAEELPSGPEVLAFARAHLPTDPVRLTGALKERAPNGFVKKRLAVEMDLNWGASPATAAYRIRDEQSGFFQTLEILWLADGPEFHYSENSQAVMNFDPGAEIDGLGVTWADLSFAFLWHPEAKTIESGKKLGRDCYVVEVPRGENSLRLWIEIESGRLLGAKEISANGRTVKEIKVVSVKEFDGLWMVKDLDILLPEQNRRTTLRIDSVEQIAR